MIPHEKDGGCSSYLSGVKKRLVPLRMTHSRSPCGTFRVFRRNNMTGDNVLSVLELVPSRRHSYSSAISPKG